MVAWVCYRVRVRGAVCDLKARKVLEAQFNGRAPHADSYLGVDMVRRPKASSLIDTYSPQIGVATYRAEA